MFSRIAARLIHVIMFIFAAGVWAIMFMQAITFNHFTTTKVKKDEGSQYDYSWLTYYLLTISAMGALQTLLWIFQSRIYENGRPTVQECVLNGLFSILYLFAAAWQFYQTFANQLPYEFLCSPDSYDSTVRCRLWQSELVGCAVCGVMFFVSTILWIVLFRSRPLVFKDLQEDMITSSSSPTTVTSALVRNDTAQRERDEAEVIAAEAERRRVLQHQQQQQQQQQMQPQQMQYPPLQQPSTGPYQQQHYQTKRVVPLQNQASAGFMNHQVQHQNSAGFMNQQQVQHQNTSGYPYQQQQARMPLPSNQASQTAIENEAYYNGNYALQKQQSYEMTPTPGGYQIKAPMITPATTGVYTEEPVGYMEAGGPSNVPNAAYNNYAYGQFNPAETFDDPTSQEAQAHLAYANQLREQQLYHQNMAEVLQKQQQQKLLKQQQLLQQPQQQGPSAPASGSTIEFYPPPPRHAATMPMLTAPSSSITGHATVGTSFKDDDPPSYATRVSRDFDTGMVTPGSNMSSSRIAGSPQLYHPDETATVTESHYSDDRYKNELLGEIRRARQAEEATEETQSHHDYKVSVKSDCGEEGTRPLASDTRYVPPPPPKSRTMWS
ncbi:hypothetical protein EDD11_002876 [Mortierella claussenii]|nr:hypothetical protein EDD11_002876 [Mortierella claussenii]